jgi:internalin A
MCVYSRTLTKLKSLNVENNSLHHLLPIAKLNNLQTLIAGKNSLGIAPKQSTQKRQQQQQQQKKVVPPLPELPVSLKQIKLDSNQFMSIPKQIMSNSLTKLVKLDLSHNNIAVVPDSISNLTSLLELNLSYNTIPR